MKNDTESAIAHLKISRATCLKLIQDLTHEQLITIPKGFNNSIYWNVAHLVVTQQLLNYKLSNLPMYLDNEVVDNFRKGSKARQNYLVEDWERIVEAFKALPIQLEVDYTDGIFKEYSEYKTSYGITLNKIDDAIAFNNIHEGLHIGYIMALKRVI